MKKILVVLLVSFLGFTSCQDDDTKPVFVDPLTDSINEWILENMESLYLWNNWIPTNPDKVQQPEEFFESLLYHGDRFSVIYPDYQELISLLSGVTKEAGYEIGLFQVQGTQDIYGAILYVKPGSPASNAGLKRGDIITKINNTSMNLENYRTVFSGINENHSITYDRFNPDLGENEEFTSSLNVLVFSENPNFLDTIYISDTGKKVGYYVYHQFTAGNGPVNFDQEMENIFADFKSEQIEELILDFRYNSGGSVNSANNLASHIAPGVTTTNIFAQYQWNPELQDYIENMDDNEGLLTIPFRSKANNIGQQLSTGRVYVLVGRRSASASEMVINSLLPFMEVVIIGETTVGKNVGSIPIEDEDNSDNNYGILPIVFRFANANGDSDFENGFIPDPPYIVEDFTFPMRAFGDVEEPLLMAALNDIDGLDPARMGGGQIMMTKVSFSNLLKPFKNVVILDNKPGIQIPSKSLQRSSGQ